MENKRLLLAILLSFGVWVLFMVLFPAPKKKPSTKSNIIKKEISEKTIQKKKTEIVKIKEKKKISVTYKRSMAANEKTVNIETEKYRIILTNRGAALKSLKLKERKNNKGEEVEVVIDKKYINKKLLKQYAFPKAVGTFDFPIHFNENEFLNGGSLENILWIQKIESNGNIHYITKLSLNGIPIQIEKIYSFPKKGYSFNIEYRLTNKGRKDVFLTEGKIIVSPTDMLGPLMDYNNQYNKSLSGIYSVNEDYEQLTKGGFFSDAGITKKVSGNITWIGLMSRYFLVIMVPEGGSGTGVISDNRNDSGYRTGVTLGIKDLKVNNVVRKKFRVYVGEKNKDKLASVDKRLIDAADISKLIEPIRYFVIWSLKWINKLVGNLGWALVIFSILSKLVFMPLTIKSTDSMKKMQALTPKIKELKEKFKDKPDDIQKETMKLYKENKVNPMGGCFPLLLQMPFFFGLYSALINSIDLWQAPFILWIQDLSMPDTILQFSFSLPVLGNNLNILPLLMTVSSLLQQKLTTADSGGQQQKMMMYIMPVFLLFIFWSMPSGLVLYWTLQNVFQILHHVIFVSRKETAEAK